MTDVIIIAPSSYQMKQLLDRVRHLWKLENEGDEHCLIRDDINHAFLDRDELVREAYEDDAVALPIFQSVPNPTFYVCSSSDFDFLKSLLVYLVDDEELWVDDDHGHILRGSAFAKRLVAERTYDWRKQP